MQKHSVATAAFLTLSLVHAGAALAARPTTGYVQDATRTPRAASARSIGGGTVVYFNRWGGTYTKGQYDSRYNTNGLGTGTIPPFECGDAAWAEVMSCLKQSFLPFDVRVTDIDPGMAEHVETVVAGSPADMGLPASVGGIAPLGCDLYLDNPVAFAFSKPWHCDPDEICWAAAQETAHTFGMDHSVECSDHMTYDDDCSNVKRFRDITAACGEDKDLPADQDPGIAGGPRRCVCTGASQQNSHTALLDIFGAHQNLSPNLAFTRPRAGAAVIAGFDVDVEVDDDFGITQVDLLVDGQMRASLAEPPFVFADVADLADGAHTLTARALDSGGLTSEVTISVTQQPPCTGNSECPSDYVCRQGDCVDGPSMPGGIGAACVGSLECQSHRCAAGPDGMRCSEPCDPAASQCPDGFSCLAAGDTGACWPGASVIQTPDDGDGGGCGCTVGGAGRRAPVVGFLLGVLGLVVLGRRRGGRFP